MDNKTLELKKLWVLEQIKSIKPISSNLLTRIQNASKKVLNTIVLKELRGAKLDFIKNIKQYIIKLSNYDYSDSSEELVNLMTHRLRKNYDNNIFNEGFKSEIDQMISFIEKEKIRLEGRTLKLTSFRKFVNYRIYGNFWEAHLLTEELNRYTTDKIPSDIPDDERKRRIDNLKGLSLILTDKFDKTKRIFNLKLMRNKQINEQIVQIKELLDLIELLNYESNKVHKESREIEDFYANLRKDHNNYIDSNDYTFLIYELIEELITKNPLFREIYEKLDLGYYYKEDPIIFELSKTTQTIYDEAYRMNKINNLELYNTLKTTIQNFYEDILRSNISSSHFEFFNDKIDYKLTNDKTMILLIKASRYDKFKKKLEKEDRINIMLEEAVKRKERIEITNDDGETEIKYVNRYYILIKYIYNHSFDQRRALYNILFKTLPKILKTHNNRKLKEDYTNISFEYSYGDTKKKYKAFKEYLKETFGIRFNLNYLALFPINSLNNEYNRIRGNKPMLKETTITKYTCTNDPIKVKQLKEDLGNLKEVEGFYAQNMNPNEKDLIEFLDYYYNIKSNRTIQYKQLNEMLNLRGETAEDNKTKLISEDLSKYFDIKTFKELVKTILRTKLEETDEETIKSIKKYFKLKEYDKTTYTKDINNYIRGSIKHYNKTIYYIFIKIIDNYYTNECIKLFDTTRSKLELIKLGINNFHSLFDTFPFKESEDLFDRILNYNDNNPKYTMNLVFKELFNAFIRIFEKNPKGLEPRIQIIHSIIEPYINKETKILNKIF